MSKRKAPPNTSIDAYHSLQPEHLAEIYRKILEALGKIGEGTFEEIASVAKLPKDRVWRRMNELQKLELVYRPGNKRPLRSGRLGYTWMLTDKSVPKTQNAERALKGKPVHEYAKSINNIAQGKFF